MWTNILARITLFLFPLSLAASDCYTHQESTKYHHWTTDIINFGEFIKLEDGSVWSIAKTEVYKVSSWKTFETVFITPNHSWFSSYKYCISNPASGSSVECEFSERSTGFASTAHWVVAFDKYAGYLFLEDGSSWKVAYDDLNLFDKWLINDFVIIGCNDSWFSFYDFILINPKAENHISANRF